MPVREQEPPRCLTDPSSATEAGEDRQEHETEPAASLCSLERVVRPAPTERPLAAGKDGRGLRRGNDGCCRRDRANGGTDLPEEQTCRQRNGNRRANGRTGTRLPSKNPARKTQGLTDPSSATAGKKATIKAGRHPAVRWSAWLGAWNSESGERRTDGPPAGE